MRGCIIRYFLHRAPGEDRAKLLGGVRGLRTDEGARSFVTTIRSSDRDSPYKRERGRENDRRLFYCCLRLFFIVGNDYIVTIFNSKMNESEGRQNGGRPASKPGRDVAVADGGERGEGPVEGRQVLRPVRGVRLDVA